NDTDGYLEQTGADIYSGVTGQYKVRVNDSNLSYSLEQVGSGFAKNFDTLYFRGTPNGWGATEMSLIADNIWEVEIYFDGQSNQRFKVDLFADWSHNYGDTNNDGFLDRTGSDIYTNLVGNYKVQVHDQTLSYQLITP
ncbi:MAG: hypothetical protein OQK04_12675, partial [Kangiellaceae bacterium]|nr:hypothetical protein [Kangiellaceae bacterium]